MKLKFSLISLAIFGTSLFAGGVHCWFQTQSRIDYLRLSAALVQNDLSVARHEAQRLLEDSRTFLNQYQDEWADSPIAPSVVRLEVGASRYAEVTEASLRESFANLSMAYIGYISAHRDISDLRSLFVVYHCPGKGYWLQESGTKKMENPYEGASSTCGSKVEWPETN